MGQLGNFLEGGGVDPNSEEPRQGFEPLKPGTYPVEVELAEIKTTRAGNGKYLKVILVVIGEQYAGRKLFANINIVNPNEDCVRIGRQELAELARACGIPYLDDEDKLIGLRLTVKVKIGKGSDGNPDNEITSYNPLGGAQAQAAPATQQQSQPAAPAQAPPTQTAPAPNGGDMPWDRK